MSLDLDYFWSRYIANPVVGPLNAATLAVLVGTVVLSRTIGSFLLVLYKSFLRPKVSLAKYGAGKGAWAVVTGASEGIGREFALQFAQAKFNILILARTPAKLEAIADEAKSKYGVEVDVHPFDFAHATDAQYEALRQQLDTLDIGVLVNNVGINHAFPTAFVEEKEDLLTDIVEVNVKTQVRLTRYILPHMISRKRGLILNIGSVAGVAPSPLLATYSASKAFLRTWSKALSYEVAEYGIDVEHVKTYFVSTKMSKIRRSFSVPSPQEYVRGVLASAGCDTDAAPHPFHALLVWALDRVVPEDTISVKMFEMHKAIRKRALRKLAQAEKSR
ncbi:hypothetical protein HK104_003892 [Borealophlyctis nickersoniae]|nr:hypothetical protein HK104_003892 [Borealophlyctis nickersoniae]